MSSAASAYMLASEEKRRVSQTPRSSFESANSATAAKSSSLSQIAKKIVKAAKEHHQAVNEAYDSYYGRRGMMEAEQRLAAPRSGSVA